MSTGRALENLVQDASSLHRLVDSVQRFCEEQMAAHAYRQPNEEFLQYAIALAEKTKEALNRAISDGRSAPKRIPIYCSDLQVIKGFWQTLHLYVKPAADAHRLRLPTSLLDLATGQLQKLSGMGKASVVTMLTPQLMYFQQPHTAFKKSTRWIASAVLGPPLPDGLGFVELPYSLAPSFLTNLVVYHELGHFVWEELEATAPPHSGVVGLKREMVSCLTKHVPGFLAKARERQLEDLRTVAYWTHEVFCDLFAIRLIGPAFSFAAIEFFNLLAMDASEWTTFRPSHPAPCCRFSEHRRQLIEGGWWTHVQNLKSGYVATIERLAKIPRVRYDASGDPVVAAFLALRPGIRRLVHDLTASAKASPGDFATYRREIEKSFLNGVVPSTVVVGGTRKHPSATAIVNASVCFYLTSMPKLMRKLQGQDAQNVSQRSHWIQRLESWTMKAVEDVQLLNRRAPN